METLFASESQQSSMPFPKSLTEVYCPRDIESFIGIPRVKKICKAFAQNPREACLLFVGDSGTGKSQMARAIARAINGELHVISSAKCDKESLENLARICSYVPFGGGWHVCVLEEADLMSPAAAAWLLTRTDDSGRLEKTVWILTCNSVDRMEDRLLSRALRCDFVGYGAGSETVALLERIWSERAPKSAERPDFKRLSSKNIRQAIQNVEIEIMAAS
jgi:DNA polymerase III delta prime subunit